ncbi:MAG TPA: hypothetical protein VKN36_04115, partial [Eudoraea sp.]|nr:hypothetical protein [Eudoraea sp.]
IFEINSEPVFNDMALEVFQLQYRKNRIYREFCDHLGIKDSEVNSIESIPFLPIEFFKGKTILTKRVKPEIIFTSSGTTGSVPSKHCVADLSLYRDSFSKTFELFYGPVGNYCILALLPSYLERQGSSLIYMAETLIKSSGHHESGFYLHDLENLMRKLLALELQGTKILLLGVSFALLEMAEKYPLTLENTIVMETGGMKGKRKELIREQLHEELKKGFGVPEIHSEYGMTELLSQAYAQRNGLFKTPPWMKVLTRETEDPLVLHRGGETGGLCIIDLANVHSCSFIATQDLGRIHKDGSFEVIGRFDHSDIRGCNLMVL